MKYALLNKYANNAVTSKHRSVKGMVKALIKMRRQLYNTTDNQNCIPPWIYGVWDEDKACYVPVQTDFHTGLQEVIWSYEQTFTHGGTKL